MTELGEKSWDLSLYELHRYDLPFELDLYNPVKENLDFDSPNIKPFASGRHRRQ